MRINDEIYATILHLLEKKGPTFTTAELAAELQVSKRTVYKMFDSKEMIIDKTIDYVFKGICFGEYEPSSRAQFYSDEVLQKYLIDFPSTRQVDKISKHAQVLEKRYPRQWRKLNTYIDEFGKKICELFIVDPHVRILTATEKKVLLITIQQTIRKLLLSSYLAPKDLNFKEAVNSLYNMLLHGIAC
ncbi:hypothetical protein JCM15457_1647 [Liquorilactobacillus sucicola DSM 21376 = JCM 15457]|nr:helix-turn-helix domain-containing protein [Liquorilactobacillus sucicola]GAJ26706.1 hypothetical protein JCM15457_1647 [Liquorilactobacillus sucicola DSM 21376 = JCM 15457]